MGEATFERYPSDGYIDVNNLPPTPWTLAALGPDIFNALAAICGVGDLSRQIDPSLNIRTFARGRAVHLANRDNITGAEFDALLAEADRLQAAIDATLPPPMGIERNGAAPPMEGSDTTRRTRKF